MRGMRTPSNLMRPLSTPLRPIFSPSSSMVTPAQTWPTVADRDDEGVHALALPAHVELGEDDGDVGVHRGVADVVLPGVVAGRLHDELLRSSASYVATVPSAWTLEPCPVSVIAKQPMSSPVISLAR